jgi:hypothetical protein
LSFFSSGQELRVTEKVLQKVHENDRRKVGTWQAMKSCSNGKLPKNSLTGKTDDGTSALLIEGPAESAKQPLLMSSGSASIKVISSSIFQPILVSFGFLRRTKAI